MKKSRLIAVLLTAIMFASCGTTGTVPITGRKQKLLVTDEQVLSLSNEQYTDYMKTAKPSTNATNTAMVKRVGQRLATAVETYLKNNGLADETRYYSWEFNLVQEQQINAFCMPGGKIVVYEGILPVTQNESSLAIVLGHEIAHAVAKHSAERISNSLRQQYGGQILGAVLQGAGVSTNWQEIGSAAFGLGSKIGGAAYSRNQESEADHLGLIFAAMAGYDPQVAVSFWQRMASASGGGSASIFSDHPADATRIKNIQGWLPEAMKYYQPSSATTTKSSTTKSSATKKKSTTTTKTTVNKNNTRTIKL